MRARWVFATAVVLALIGVVVAARAVFAGNYSPHGFVADQYTRAPERDLGGEAKAYTSSQSPSTVADEITAAWAPADRYVDGSGIYLRYADDSVVIRPLAPGSLILVEGMRTAYPRYSTIVGGYWGWGSGWGESTRGGGPGGGK